MTELQHDEVPVTDYTLSDEDMKVIENNARMFSAITSEANALAPLLMQSFPVRFKNNKEARESWFRGYNPLGETVECVVAWGGEGHINFKDQSCFWLQEVGTYRQFCIHPLDFKDYITQKGLVVKMFKAWQQATGNL